METVSNLLTYNNHRKKILFRVIHEKYKYFLAKEFSNSEK